MDRHLGYFQSLAIIAVCQPDLSSFPWIHQEKKFLLDQAKNRAKQKQLWNLYFKFPSQETIPWDQQRPFSILCSRMGGCRTISLDPKLTAHFDGTDQTTWTLSVSGMARLFPTQTPWSSRTRSSHGLLLFFPFSQQPSQWRLSQAISTPSLGFILFCFCNTGAGTWGLLHIN